MKITSNEQDGVHLIGLSGELDFHSSPELREKLQVAIELPSSKVLVNMKGVSYIDSSGLATFVEALQKSKASSSRLVLAELAPSVKGVFEIAKLDSIFSLADSSEEAHKLLA